MQIQEYQGYIKQGHFIPYNEVVLQDSDKAILTIINEPVELQEQDTSRI